jgi:acyl CoA:acetate/3-ketoacid CoA transferase
MPTLKQLIEELQNIKIDPAKVRVPGMLYDDVVAHVEEEMDTEVVDEDDE